MASGSQPVVEETTHLLLRKAGRLAPRWLNDFISGELDDELDEDNDDRNDILHVGCATAEFRRDMAKRRGIHCPDNVTPPVLRHELLLKGHQSLQDDKEKKSTQPPRRADGDECDEVLACVCQNCRYHFTFYIDRKKEHLCGTLHGNKTDPFHHLVRVFTDTSVPRSINTKFYPYHALAKFACSAERCDYKISVEISSPRLSDRLLGFLCDNDAIRSRLKRALEEEPQRFADFANVTPNALAYLRAYLRDIVDENREKNPDGTVVERKIDQRNKKFYIQFGNGPEAAELLTYLGFVEVVGEDSRSWKVPSPPFTRPTRPGSQLAFYQDVKSEVETIIGKDSQNLKPNTAISFITTALDIGSYSTTDQKEKDILALYQASDFARLGLTPTMHEMYFWYAYTCQCQVKPKDDSKFFESLERLAIGRNSEDLEMRVQSAASMRTTQPQVPETESLEEDEIRRATELSLQDAQPSSAVNQMSSLDRVTQAYKYFGLAEDQRSDDEVLGKFVSNSEAYPSQKTSLREKLLLIARHTNSANLEGHAVEDMTLEESLQYLDVQLDTDAAFIVNVAQYGCNTGEKDYALVAVALEQIGKARGNDAALLSAAQDISGDHGGEGKFLLDLSGQMNVDTVSSRPRVVDMSLPVGLDNIRNTCYLNSILQYFYTVKPIHDVLHNIDEIGLPYTEASLQSRHIDPGSESLKRGEAYAGRQFVEQISSLYHDMQQCQDSSLKPQQRLAIAALKNHGKLEEDGNELLVKDNMIEQNNAVAFNLASPSRAGTPAPPLPLRHTSASLAAAAQSTTIHVNSPSSLQAATTALAPDAETADSASIQSSQTLVLDESHGGNQADAVPPQPSQVSVSMAEVQEDDDVVHDIPMVVHVEQTGGTDAPPSYKASTSGVSGDASMTDAPAVGVQTVFDPPPTLEPTVEEKIDRALNDTTVKGTDQQDVEEVMGNIFSHLRAAVRATGIDEVTGYQRDPITDTFFWTSASYSRSEQTGAYNRQVAPNRAMSAFPDEHDKLHLLQALSNNFQREFITQGTWYEKFTSIVTLPPILHIHIQRTKGDGTKNRTAITIPEVLHLDQFMDCEEGTELFSRRRHAWNLQERIRSLKGPNGEPMDIVFPPQAIGKATHYTNVVADECIKRNTSTNNPAEIDEMRQATVEDASLGDDEFSEVSVPSDDDEAYVVIDNELQGMLDAAGIVAANAEAEIEAAGHSVDAAVDRFCQSEANKPFFDAARNMTPEELEKVWERQDLAEKCNQMMRHLGDTESGYKEELDGLFEDLKDPRNAYRLHAVVCHSGNTGTAGHYWVWVYDFERSIWRKYNDSVVEEQPDSSIVMNQLSNQGEPYYLAYVRALDVEKYVGVPLRQEPAQQPPGSLASGTPSPPPCPVPKRVSEDDSSDSSSPKSTPLTDDVSTTMLSPAPPPSHPTAHRLTTPPLEVEESQVSVDGGYSGQVDGSTLASRPMPPPPPPLPPTAQTRAPESARDIQEDSTTARETPQ
ncbi:ubiquitin-specific protease ubp2 [Sporothrix curviconia]|uniref:ubiquitinyl hydrolase 1 n=1 Tax=Sporothrix curviconia TaxID=1260050 RepID=A0ABP0AN89_9PEZI